ncbi:MAG: DUF4156 domain-containing protein [Rhizobiaceae bacterium]|nr:DUF4156 domain-containing protein [Rhizobiaceae bacterium]
MVLTNNAGMVSGCKFLGQHTVSSLQQFTPDVNRKDIETTLKNKIAEVGGTHGVTPGPVAQNVNSLLQTADVYRC